jgi:hypothetical protein
MAVPAKVGVPVGGGGGGGGIFIYSSSARRISFEMNLKTKKLKRNSSGRTRIYEYTLPINALVTPLVAAFF